jgi:hypothetical protein
MKIRTLALTAALLALAACSSPGPDPRRAEPGRHADAPEARPLARLAELRGPRHTSETLILAATLA